ncbi:MAG: M3 family oligoendopeptidase [Phycisphaerales bacterium]|nr:M3 family oligoendopeptidase [Phycisphaerales bacterium]
MIVANRFVPADVDASRWENIEPFHKALLERPIDSIVALEEWLLDRSELDAACSEARANLYIRMTCHTDDQQVQQAYTSYVETVEPKLAPAGFELDKRQTELSRTFGLAEVSGGRYIVLDRDTAVEVDLFRDENVPLNTQLTLLAQNYDQVIGAMTVEFDGQERTLPQMGKYQESTDRQVRESAWRAVADRRLKDSQAIDELYEKMIPLRDTIARNAGFESFVGYAFMSKHRFDYGVEECLAFHNACEKVVVPFMRRLDDRRKKALKLDKLRPWDLAVDTKGRPPLKPFEGGRELMSRSVETFRQLDPRLAAMLAELGDGTTIQGSADGVCLDLDSRKGKAPGGYQYMRDRSRKPFIFMNAAGLHRDMTTMLHEAGHAFHSLLSRDEPLVAYRHAPIEFCEVASMSMELLTMPHWRTFFKDKNDLARAQRKQMEESVTLLPWIATIDAFQHWIYRHPTHTRDQRTAKWLELDQRFGHEIAWDGLEPMREKVWQRQGHLFDHPFYYIEYGIAQLGALGLWVHSLEKGPESAVDAYMSAMKLGGSRPLPELFEAAGLAFEFGPDVVKRLVDRVEKELEKVPE